MQKYEAPTWILEFIQQDLIDINTIKGLIEMYASSRSCENIKFLEIDENREMTENETKLLFEVMTQNRLNKKDIIERMRNIFLKYNISPAKHDLTASEILEALNKDKSLREKNDIGDSLMQLVVKSKILSVFEQEKVLEKIINKEPEMINDKNKHGESVISVAVSLGKMYLVKRLIDVPECDVNIRDNAENTPLILAISSDQGTEIAKLLISVTSVDVNASNKEDNFPLLLATKTNNSEVVKLLLNHPMCDVNKKSCDGDTSFHVAHKNGHDGVIVIFQEWEKLETALKVLDKHGESPLTLHLKRFGDCTPFSYDFWKDLSKYTHTKEIVNWAPHTLATAVERCPVHVCKRLLEAGADVNSSYPDGQTALILAISARCREKIEILMKYGPQCTGPEIYQHAIESGCDNAILQMLFNHFVLEKSDNDTSDVRKIGSETNDGRHVSLHSTRLNYYNIEDAITAVPHHDQICSLVCNDVLTVLNEISQKTKNTTETSYLSFYPEVVGSLKEKTCALGDIDIACILKEPDGIMFDQKRQVLKVNKNSPWGTCCNEKDILCPKLTNEKFSKFLSLRFKEHTNPKNTSVVKNLYFLIRDKVPCIRVLASFQEVQSELYCDIVPIFNINKIDFIHKVSRHNNNLNVDYLRYPISHNVEESEKIIKTSDTQKSALKVAKLLRICKTFKLDENQLNTCHLNPNFDPTNFVTSYMLKHSLLKVCNAEWLEVKANDIISQLSNEFEMGRVESYFDDAKILCCEHNQGKPFQHYIDDCISAACCLTRITAIHICHNMIKWISGNPDLADDLHTKLLQQLSGLLYQQWKRQKSLGLPTKPYSLRLIDDQLWQCHHGGISVFTLDLKHVRYIPSGDTDCGDVASTGPEEVVVAAHNGLYSLNREGNVTNTIANGEFSSVCHHEDQLFAAAYDNDTVHVYMRSGSKWRESSSFRVAESEEWDRATLCVNSAGVYACLQSQHKFYHYSHSGALLSSTGSEGRGIDEMSWPFLCSVDSAGTALIADCFSHRLKLLSSSGTWNVIDIQPPVQEPRSALFYNDRLYVNSWSDNSLKMYTRL